MSVKTITELTSVDLVVNPAMNIGLYQHRLSEGFKTENICQSYKTEKCPGKMLGEENWFLCEGLVDKYCPYKDPSVSTD